MPTWRGAPGAAVIVRPRGDQEQKTKAIIDTYNSNDDSYEITYKTVS
jgi:hypothetical protein